MMPAPVTGWRDAANAVIDAYRDLGMRVSFAMCNRDQHRLVYENDDIFVATLPADMQDETTAFLKRSHFRLEDFETEYLQPMIERHGVRGDPLVRLWLSADQPRARLRPAADADQRVGAEVRHGASISICRRRSTEGVPEPPLGKSSVAHLADIGFLGPHLTLGHGTWMDEADLDLIHQHGVCICHNASSNLRLRSGIAPVNALVARNIPVALRHRRGRAER